MARPASDIRARLIEAARARFLQDGVDGASLRTIASDARTNVGMIVYWFATKDDLFLAVVEDVYARLLGDLESTLEGDAPLRERLSRAFQRIASGTDEEADTIRLVVREALLVPASPRFAKVLGRFRQGHLALMARVLGDAAARGELDAKRPLPLTMIATFGMGALPQIIRRVAGGAPPFSLLPPPEELAEHAVDLLFGGIGPRAVPREKEKEKKKKEKEKKTTTPKKALRSRRSR